MVISTFYFREWIEVYRLLKVLPRVEWALDLGLK